MPHLELDRAILNPAQGHGQSKTQTQWGSLEQALPPLSLRAMLKHSGTMSPPQRHQLQPQNPVALPIPLWTAGQVLRVTTPPFNCKSGWRSQPLCDKDQATPWVPAILWVIPTLIGGGKSCCCLLPHCDAEDARRVLYLGYAVLDRWRYFPELSLRALLQNVFLVCFSRQRKPNVTWRVL